MSVDDHTQCQVLMPIGCHFLRLGTVGLAVIDACRIAGAGMIIGVDTNPKKEEIARHFGASDFLNPSTLLEQNVQQKVIEMTGGTGEALIEILL